MTSCTHAKARILLPGEEAEWVKPPYVCALCQSRPFLLCLDCHACVCANHGGRVCPAVDQSGNRCVRGVWQGRPHDHAFDRQAFKRDLETEAARERWKSVYRLYRKLQRSGER